MNSLIPLSLAFAFLPFHFENTHSNSFAEKNIESLTAFPVTIESSASVLYKKLKLDSAGLSKKAFECAYRGYISLGKKGRLCNEGILTIIDLSQSSKRKRFYILDLINNKVLLNTYVSHGKGSGGEFATRFSNKPRSHQSSLGFYVTGEPYVGQHGISLRMKGLEFGFNHLATKRNIVVHGAKYIGDNKQEIPGTTGRSFGCPAVPEKEAANVIDLIKNGTCLFIYHPTKRYLQTSKILND